MMYEEKGVCLYVCRHWDEEVLGLGKHSLSTVIRIKYEAQIMAHY
jgi:hypothetical protein